MWIISYTDWYWTSCKYDGIRSREYDSGNICYWESTQTIFSSSYHGFFFTFVLIFLSQLYSLFLKGKIWLNHWEDDNFSEIFIACIKVTKPFQKHLNKRNIILSTFSLPTNSVEDSFLLFIHIWILSYICVDMSYICVGGYW